MTESRSTTPLPLSLGKDSEGRLVIDWNDGHHSVFAWKHLRNNCPCAGCREERMQAPDPFRILKPEELAPKPPLAPVSMTPVGYYAYKITWNDGHDTGLYTLETLRELCQCVECQKLPIAD